MAAVEEAGGQGAWTIVRVNTRETTAAGRAARGTTGTDSAGALGEAATGPAFAFRRGALVLLRASVWPRNELAASAIWRRRASLPGSVVASLKRLQHRRRAWAREAKADGT